jgi:hypothetical protein
MKLIDVITAAEGRVSGGDKFQWKCWGDNARFMEFADINGSEFCSVVFDTKTYDVYDIEIFIPDTDICFRWFNPAFIDSYINEAKVRNIDYMLAWDSIKFIPVNDAQVIIEYIKDVMSSFYEDLAIPEEIS